MDFLKRLNIQELNDGISTGKNWISGSGEIIESHSPVDRKLIARVRASDRNNYDAVVTKAQEAFLEWRLWPAPKRGEIVRQIGEALREYKDPLGRLVSYEMGTNQPSMFCCTDHRDLTGSTRYCHPGNQLSLNS